mmetsp:Transcript_60247/g.135635  ORF Transcript_60247/g.135635 Transcript_60247/m.135635 type:complete len:99 (-) Transcript_60247:519-815(-)
MLLGSALAVLARTTPLHRHAACACGKSVWLAAVLALAERAWTYVAKQATSFGPCPPSGGQTGNGRAPNAFRKVLSFLERSDTDALHARLTCASCAWVA